MTPRLLIACIGNIFLGDDAFGCAVARQLATRPLPEGVRLVDFGIRGFDLALALLDDTVDAAILVDTVARGEPPGTLYVIEPEWAEEAGSDFDGRQPVEMHALEPDKVLRLVLTLGGRPKRVFLVGCEPTPFDEDEDIATELSAAVGNAVVEAAGMVESLAARILEGREVGITR